MLRKPGIVASLAEAWIEIFLSAKTSTVQGVASLAEAWIEIGRYVVGRSGNASPPSRRRGLKYKEVQ